MSKMLSTKGLLCLTKFRKMGTTTLQLIFISLSCGDRSFYGTKYDPHYTLHLLFASVVIFTFLSNCRNLMLMKFSRNI